MASTLPGIDEVTLENSIRAFREKTNRISERVGDADQIVLDGGSVDIVTKINSIQRIFNFSLQKMVALG